MKASYYRRQAWSALRGKWGISILGGLVASVLGATSALVSTQSISFDFNTNEISGKISDLFVLFEQDPSTTIATLAIIIGIFAVIATASLIYSAVIFCVGSVVGVGYSRFNLNIIDNKPLSFSHIFSFFKHWWRAILANLISSLFISLWSLLFVIPGAIATYRYSMVPFILAENPDMSPMEAVKYSKQIMHGNKWKLFCLNFSFFGWNMLCILTFGVLNIWMIPYKHAALAAFYRNLIPAPVLELEGEPEET